MTEVQSVEPAEPQGAVPGAPEGACIATGTEPSPARRLKRTASPSDESSEQKRARTAPATPIHTSSNGVEASGDKAHDEGGAGVASAGPQRSSGAASAPASLNRPTASRPAATPGKSSPGRAHASAGHGHPPPHGGSNRHSSAAGPQAVLQHVQPQHAAAEPSSIFAPLLQRNAGAAAPAGPNSSATTDSYGAAPSGARPSTSGAGTGAAAGSRHHTPHRANHHHDALEEQVFSPGFHLPQSTTSGGSHGVAAAAAAAGDSTPMSHGGGGSPGAHRTPFSEGRPSPSKAGDEGGAAAAAAAGDEGGMGSRLASLLAIHPAPGMGQLHAIDLNVVDAVAVDTDDDESQQQQQAGPGPASEAAAATAGAGNAGRAKAGGRPPSARTRRQTREAQQGPAAGTTHAASGEAAEPADHGDAAAGKPVATATTSSISGGAIAAVGEELSSSSGGEAGQPGEEEEEYGDDEEFDNDENAHPGRHQQNAAAQRQQQQPQAYDAVLVASAPRALAAAVSAALPTSTLAAAAAAPGADAAGSHAAVAGGEEAGEDEEEDEEEEEEFVEFDPLLFIKQLPPLEQCVPLHRPALLPKQTRAMARRKTLVLDLDETLVHSSLEAVDRSDFNFPVTFNGMDHTVYVRQRPHLHDFMARVAALFEVVVFTASQRIYAERLLDILDPGQALVRHRIYRDSCVVVDGNYLKDLSVLGRDLAHTVIVDNSPQAFGFQVDNGIPIESWYDDDADTELLKLLPFLESLAATDVDDVRPRIRQQFRLQELIDRSG
ncbi:hypothetical protein HXX76_005987 [Chlamydomonas incerta]|uniref:FCP1 homology domain-containing protein n=1 Tax=Chlamydomonas incerta TaxID=51695 RepID=A0A835TGH1_CHLIN|nr:hypothetical protein HXX76_005987 [Chlamydomonas incerta]|eukprot:KAG2437330.1 hypothetical protein HXX76_005987 [Chlamydomonas incerta]